MGFLLTPDIISVSIEFGPAALTPILWDASASKDALINCITPPFDTQYAAIEGMATAALIDDILTIEPSLLFAHLSHCALQAEKHPSQINFDYLSMANFYISTK